MRGCSQRKMGEWAARPFAGMTLDQLRAANTLRQKEWDTEGKLDLLFFAVELAGEVGELCNVIKKLHRQIYGVPGSIASLVDLAEELADVIIVADLLAAKVGINLNAAVIEKFNRVSQKRGFRTELTRDGAVVQI